MDSITISEDHAYFSNFPGGVSELFTKCQLDDVDPGLAIIFYVTLQYTVYR